MTTREVRYATRWREAAQLPVGVLPRVRRGARDLAISLQAMLAADRDDRFLRCLFCHYVFDDQREAFERILVALKALGSFVDTDTCVAMLNGERPITGRHFHLSFDDGFRNNCTNAAPLLRAHAIPAIFFVPSAVIGADAAGTAAYCSRIQYPATIELMGWEEVRSLADQGFAIGSHTRTHARFSDVSADPAKLEEEIAGSKRDLEARLGIECKYISWPYGKRTDADAPSLAMAKSAGYRACFGAYRGSIRPGVTDRFSIPRHHFEAEWPLSHIRYFARGNREVGS